MAQELPAQAVVIFGASGDLTKRKLLPAFYHLFLQGLLPRGFAIVGYSRTELSDDEFREIARDGVEEFSAQAPAGEVWRDFVEHLSYVPGEFSDPGAMNHVVDHLKGIDERRGTAGRRLFYAATPAVAYPDIVHRVAEAGMHTDAKIVFEKPFGHDLASARELNATIHEVFDESQVFRIDHYLGKETVQNVLAFRFANGLFEPVWNRRYIDHVQITVAEDIGIEARGAFYEQTGAIRDMIATHLFQVMTFVSMEPPVSFEPNRLRDETVKVLRSTMVCDPDRVVRGQYRGYRQEPGVSDESTVETFAAMEVEIDNWRWSGVPFYLRTGKMLAGKESEVTLKFRKVPFNVFRGTDMDLPKRDHLTIRIQPDEGITLAVNAKRPGPGLDLGRVTLDFDYEEEFEGRIADAYELLLLEAMEGDHTLFLRQDDVERSWEILAPVLVRPSPVQTYEPDSWGPAAADALIHPRKWHMTQRSSRR
ncbi:MAG TPA: glucose-6-phosphate dehydrogenase [Actinomycetota bacterium]